MSSSEPIDALPTYDDDAYDIAFAEATKALLGLFVVRSTADQQTISDTTLPSSIIPDEQLATTAAQNTEDGAEFEAAAQRSFIESLLDKINAHEAVLGAAGDVDPAETSGEQDGLPQESVENTEERLSLVKEWIREQYDASIDTLRLRAREEKKIADEVEKTRLRMEAEAQVEEAMTTTTPAVINVIPAPASDLRPYIQGQSWASLTQAFGSTEFVARRNDRLIPQFLVEDEEDRQVLQESSTAMLRELSDAQVVMLNYRRLARAPAVVVLGDVEDLFTRRTHRVRELSLAEAARGDLLQEMDTMRDRLEALTARIERLRAEEAAEDFI